MFRGRPQKGHKRHKRNPSLFLCFCAFMWLKPEFDEAVEDNLEGDFEERNEKEWHEG